MYGLVQLASLKHIRARLVAQLNFGAFIEPACCVVRLVACIVFFFLAWKNKRNFGIWLHVCTSDSSYAKKN
jgi:hypothetical protein